MFEVSKADDEEKTNSTNEDSSGQKLANPPQSSSALRVTIPTELQGVAYIMVLCQKGKFSIFSLLIRIEVVVFPVGAFRFR